MPIVSSQFISETMENMVSDLEANGQLITPGTNFIKKYVLPFTTDGVNKTYIASHNFNTQFVFARVLDSNNQDVKNYSFKNSSNNALSIIFDTIPSSGIIYTVYMIGI